MREITVNLKMFNATIVKISVLMDPHEMKMNHNFSLENQLELGTRVGFSPGRWEESSSFQLETHSKCWSKIALSHFKGLV